MSNLINNFKKYDLGIKGVRLPSFDIDVAEKNRVGVPEDCDNLTFLTALCNKRLEGLKEEFQLTDEQYKEYEKRTEDELKELNNLSFVDYILLVWDVINFCNSNNVATGMGRGSAAGSLVLFLINVTRIDPIKHDLYFQRFVSKTRAKKQVIDGVTYLDGGLMADIDLDICYYDRNKVLEYLENEYVGKTSKILTLNTLSGKLVIKECGKIVGGLEEQEVNKISDMIPKKYGDVKDIHEACYENAVDEEGNETSEPLLPQFRQWCEENPHIFKTACKLRGLIKNKSVHPSAILLSYEDLEDTCPTELDKSKESLVSAYDATWVSLTNVKLDVLGLRGVSVVDRTLRKIEEIHGTKIRQRDIISEHATEENLWNHLEDLRQRHGLFHIEADTAYKVCRQVKPTSVDELSAVLALARPGAIDFTDQYAESKNEEKDSKIHPFFDDELQKTHGVVLYQEQLMSMAHKMGFTLDEAELMRRIVGKKKVNEVKKWQKKVRKLVNKDEELKVKNDKGQDAGNVFWKILEDSANYSFNKSHSISYASLSASTVYLKFNYPKEFFLSLLQMTQHEPDPMAEIAKIQKELDWFGIKLLPPHILKSEQDFTIEGNDLRFGLSSIRGVSETTMEKIDKFRTDEKYKTYNKFQVFQVAKETGINIGVLSALIQAGALEGFGVSRTRLVYEAQLWNLLTDREKSFVAGAVGEDGEHEWKIAKNFNFDLRRILYYLDKEAVTDKGKKFLRETRLETLRKKSQPYADIFRMNSKNEEFANWYYEKHFLGYSYYTTLKNLFKTQMQNLSDLREVEESMVDRKIKYVGWVEDSVNRKSKNGNRYNQTIVSDEKAEMRTMIFNKKRDACEEAYGRLPRKKDIVIVEGTKKDGVVFADTIEIPNIKIYTKLSELKG